MAMDFTWLSYAWAVFNSACVFVTALCAMWLVRHVSVREGRRAAQRDGGDGVESAPTDGEREEL